MDLVQVKIRTTVITHRYGTLSTGDILRTDAAYAKHLVEDCGAADYMDAPKVEEQEQEQQETPAASKTRTKRETK